MAKEIICAVTNDLVYDQRMIRICGTLAKDGFKVKLIGRELKNSLPLKKAEFAQERLRCWFNSGKLFYLEYNLRLFLKIRNTKAWAYMAVDLDTIAPLFYQAERVGAKKIYDAHEYFTEVPELIGRPRVKAFWESIAKKFVPKADLAYTVAHNLGDELNSRYGINFHVIRNMPDLRPQEKREIKYDLIYQGALNRGRGLETMVMAMHKIDGKLLICGEGDLSKEIREMVEREGLNEKIEFAGKLMPEELWKRTQEARVGLNLLEAKSLSYWYSLANKFFDYIQAGIPQVCMAFPEYLMLSRRNQVAMLLAQLDPDELASTVNHLLNHPDRYELMKAECIQAAKVLNWHSESGRLITLYRDLEKS